MVIQKGDVFECIKDVVMEDNDEIAYEKGKQYRSDQDDCITNESGDINHYWNNVDYTKDHFRKINPNDKYCQKEGIKETEGKLNYELDFEFITQMAERMSANKGKYKPYNWKKQHNIEDLKQALFRHVIEVMNGNYDDDDVERAHFASISLNSMMINYQLKTYKNGKDMSDI